VSKHDNGVGPWKADRFDGTAALSRKVTLHTHPRLEEKLGLGANGEHCIVDRAALKELIEAFAHLSGLTPRLTKEPK
jgi:hypothetical protein